jgi:hypothetical protein
MPDEDNFFALQRLDDAKDFFESVLQNVDEDREEFLSGRLIPAPRQVLGVTVRCGDFVALCHFRQRLAEHGEISYLAYNVALQAGRLTIPLDKSLEPPPTVMWPMTPQRQGRLLQTAGAYPRYDDIESSRS